MIDKAASNVAQEEKKRQGPVAGSIGTLDRRVWLAGWLPAKSKMVRRPWNHTVP
jgi:hypothetical protein